MQVIAGCLKDAWFKPALAEQRVFLLDRCLKALTSKRNMYVALHKLTSILESDVGLSIAIPAKSEILSQIRNWGVSQEISGTASRSL